RRAIREAAGSVAYLPGAVARTIPTTLSLHDRQVCPPRTDRVTILFRHYPGNLRNVAEVMSNPCREELSQRHGAELRMHALQRELRVGESPTGKLRQIFGTQAREFVEQLWKRLPFALPKLREAVVRREPRVDALRQDDLRAGNPVSPLAVHEVPDDVVGAPRVRTFVGFRPFAGQPEEHRAERRGCALENGDALLEIEIHVWRSVIERPKFPPTDAICRPPDHLVQHAHRRHGRPLARARRVSRARGHRNAPRKQSWKSRRGLHAARALRVAWLHHRRP